MQELRNFFFDTQLVRVVQGPDGEPWFVGADVARVLGYANPHEAVRTHCKGVSEILTPSSGGEQATKCIPEGDLYRLIIRSKLPAAEKFEAWVVGEVLPSIRKTGGYHMAPGHLHGGVQVLLTASRTDILRMALSVSEERDALKAQTTQQEAAIATLEPKAAYADRVASADGTHSIADAAKILGTGQNRLFALLRQWGYLIPGTTKPYQTYIDNGMFKILEWVFEDRHGIDRLDCKTLITGKSMLAVERKMQADGRLIRPQHIPAQGARA